MNGKNKLLCLGSLFICDKDKWSVGDAVPMCPSFQRATYKAGKGAGHTFGPKDVFVFLGTEPAPFSGKPRRSIFMRTSDGLRFYLPLLKMKLVNNNAK